MTIRRSANNLLIAVLEIIIALFLGIVITFLGLGSVAWIFGGMGAGVIVVRSYQLISKKTLKQNKLGRQIGQAMVGLSIGFAIADSNFLAASSRLPLFIFLSFFMFLCGSGIGYFYSRISRTNLLNAMLATVPGGVATMSGIAAEYNRNVSLVAMVQTLRITSVILIIPLIAGTSETLANQTIFSFQDYLIKSDPVYLCLLILAIVAAWLGVLIAKKLRIPAASFFGTLMVGIVFNYAIAYIPLLPNLNFTPPQAVSVIGQILLGVTVGEAWSSRVDITGKNVTHAFISVGMTIVSGFVAAIIATSVTSWDWITCILMTAPGGSTEMILVALALDHNPEIVTIAHSVRLMALNLSLPLWIFLFQYWEKRTTNY
ncbi:membrane protein AbrB duplication [Xenococcus sp. PCC 7305]|uniref:AbrB family transcriptional regulator n=1 Tax=Xenococcus sp. PCC 7305 TaxID=102125 RepID=UPI0002AC0C52|nr:AbrB family transcriptional regulator [Xenococcus sp. PCC 7305]ELS00816.1 membrane protein AbrB duplication [Xenococcus sp. PCC 7305]